MFDADSTLLYTEALIPPDGMTLVAGIGTAYSLQDSFLLSILPAFIESSKDGSDRGIGWHTKRAIQAAKGKMSLFVQNGNRNFDLVGEEAKGLCATLGELIVPISRPKGVFHPKIWLLRFCEQKRKKYAWRLVISSRNMTSDISLDQMLVIEGSEKGKTNENSESINEEIQKFLLYLEKQTSKNVHKVCLKKLKEVKNVSWNIPNDYKNICINFHGIGRSKWTPPQSFSRLAVISPFMDQCGLEYLVGCSEKIKQDGKTIYIYSRVNVLSKNKEYLKNFFNNIECNAINEGLFNLTTGQESTRYSGLHAKCYIYDITQKKENCKVRIALGSSNATGKGLSSNATGQDISTEKNNDVNVEVLVSFDLTYNFDDIRDNLNEFFEKKDFKDIQDESVDEDKNDILDKLSDIFNEIELFCEYQRQKECVTLMSKKCRDGSYTKKIEEIVNKYRDIELQVKLPYVTNVIFIEKMKWKSFIDFVKKGIALSNISDISSNSIDIRFSIYGKDNLHIGDISKTFDLELDDEDANKIVQENQKRVFRRSPSEYWNEVRFKMGLPPKSAGTSFSGTGMLEELLRFISNNDEYRPVLKDISKLALAEITPRNESEKQSFANCKKFQNLVEKCLSGVAKKKR